MLLFRCSDAMQSERKESEQLFLEILFLPLLPLNHCLGCWD